MFWRHTFSCFIIDSNSCCTWVEYCALLTDYNWLYHLKLNSSLAFGPKPNYVENPDILGNYSQLPNIYYCKHEKWKPQLCISRTYRRFKYLSLIIPFLWYRKGEITPIVHIRTKVKRKISQIIICLQSWLVV
jgi:hypothetical protein